MEATERIDCPHCGASLKAKALPPAGAKVKCPKCAGEFRYSPKSPAQQAVESKPIAPAAPPPLPAKSAAPSVTPRKPEPKKSSGSVGLVAALVVLLLLATGGGLAAWKLNLFGPTIAKNDTASDNTKPKPDAGAPVDVQAHPQDPIVDDDNKPHVADDNAGKNVGLPEKLTFADWPLAIAYSPDGAYLAAAGETGASIWNRTSGKLTRVDLHTTRDDFQFRLSPNGAYATIIGRDPQNFSRFHGGVWSTKDGKQVFTYEWADPPVGYIPGFAFSPKGTYFASLAPNNVIVVTDLAKAAEAARLEGHTARIGAIAFSADEKLLFSGSGDITDGTTRQWTLAPPQNSSILITGKAVGAIAALPDGKTLITSGFGDTNQWSLTADGSASLAHNIAESATSLQVGADGISVYLVDPNKVAVWNSNTGAFSQPKLEVSVALPDEFKSSSLSHDGRTFCVLSRTGLAIWDVATRQRRAQFNQKGNEGFALLVGLSPDGTEIAAIENDGALVRKKTGGAIVAPTQVLALKSGVRGLRFGSSDQRLAIDLIPNAVNEHDPDFSLAFRQGAEAYATFERKLDEQKSTFDQARNKARDALIQRVQNENRGNVDLMSKRRDAALLKFDEETRNFALEKIGKLKQSTLAKLHAALREKFGAAAPWGELAAIWKLRTPSAETVFSQPPFEAEEFPYNALNPASIAGPSILDPASPVGVGKWNQLPHALLHGSRLLWFDRLRGAIEVSLDSLKSSPLKEPDLEIRHWLLSPDGNQLFVRGIRKPKREITKENIFGNAVTEVMEEKQPVCGIYNLQTQTLLPIQSISESSTAIDACFTPDSKRLIAVATQTPIETESGKRSLHQFEVAMGAESGAPITYPDFEALHEMAVSPDGKWLAMIRGRQNTKLYLIDLATGNERPTTAPENIAQPIFSPDSKALAIAVTGHQQQKHEVQIIDVAKGQARATLKDWGSYVHALAFSPDSQILVVGGGSLESTAYRDAPSMLHELGHATGEMRTYSADTGAAIASLAGHSDVVTCLVFDKSGARLASGGLDRAVKIWDVASIHKAAEPKAPAPKPNAPIAEKPAANAPKNSPATPKRSENNAASAEPKIANPKLQTNSLGMKFLVVPPGEFQMGTPGKSRVDTDPGERPEHLVRLTKPTTIGIHEVTVGQFRAFVDATRHATDAEKEGVGSSGYDPVAKRFVEDENRREFNWKNIGIEQSEDCPVTNVSWNDAQAFCVWLSGKEGKRYRLPTEAEWEYCCRAGAKTRFATGEAQESVIGHGNFADASLREKWPAALWCLRGDDHFPFTAPVGKFKANAFGLYDMVGNVAEWCEDFYDPAYYARSPQTDPPGAASGDTRVVRGGSWYNDETGQRPAMRVPGWPPNWRSVVLGFRVVREEGK